MSIGEIEDSGEPFEKNRDLPSHRPERWDQIGKVSLFISSISALGAFIPAACKKKRVYQPIPFGLPAASFASVEAAIEPLPPKEKTPLPPCSSRQKQQIQELFGALADPNVNLTSPFVGLRLYRLGNQIEPLHPFTVLAHIPKKTMQGIFNTKSSFRIDQVVGGFQKKIEREMASQNIEVHLPALAEAMGKDLNTLKQLISIADQKKLLEYLFDIAAGPPKSPSPASRS